MDRTSSSHCPPARLRRFKSVIAASLSLLAQTLNGAATSDDAINAAALRNVVTRARAGQPQAQLALADYLYGKGDYANAAGWYRVSAERGILEAQLAYATCLVSGRGVQQDLAEAGRWSRVVASRVGTPTVPQALNGRILFKLAELHSSRGDTTNAASWYRVAAERGHTEAQLALATSYRSGRGMVKDPQEAARWSRIAAGTAQARVTPSESEAASLPPSTAVSAVPAKTETTVRATAPETTSRQVSSSKPTDVTAMNPEGSPKTTAQGLSSRDLSGEPRGLVSDPAKTGFSPSASPKTEASSGVASLLASVTPPAIPVAAREPSHATRRSSRQDSSIRPDSEEANGDRTSKTLPPPSDRSAATKATSPQLNGREDGGSASLRLKPEEIGPGIRFRRITDLPPLVPEVQDERAVIRPLVELR